MNTDFITEMLIANEGLIIASSALSALFCVLLVWRTLLWRDPMAGRLATIHARGRSLKAATIIATRRSRRADQGMSAMRLMVKRLHLLKSKEAVKATLLLARAGIRKHDALILYFFLRLALPFAFGAVAILFIYVLPIAEMSPVVGLMVSLLLVGCGAYAPIIFLKNAIAKREKALRKGVPDALDLLVICAEAGQSLDAALKRVAKETGRFCPEIAEELELTSVEMGLMPERRAALDNLVARADIPELRNVVNVLIQTEKYGTPLAQSLRVLSSEYRQQRLMRSEEKAARLPATMTVPMIIFILPPLFVVLIGPAVIRVIDVLLKM
jgi:tight adherence protein C